MAAICVGATDFIGGGTGALDSYDGSSFTAGDGAVVFKNGQFIPYIFVSSSEAENSPWFIRPDVNGTGVGWRAVIDNGLNVIRSNLNLYVYSTGNDSNNGMSTGTPWATLNKAIEWLGDKIILPTVTVTVNFNSATIVHSSTVEINGPQYRNVVLNGNGSANTILSFASAGVGGIKIDKNTQIGDIKNLKILGNGSSGYGIEVNNGSTLVVSAGLLVDSFDTGVFLNNDSSILANTGGLSSKNHNNHGIFASYESSGNIISCVFDNNGSRGVFASNGSRLAATSVTSTNNNTGFYALHDSWIRADSATVSGNTTDYSPAKTTANDPTFGNFGSYIYG